MEEKMTAEESAALEAMQNETPEPEEKPAKEPATQEDTGDVSDAPETEDDEPKAEFKSTRTEEKKPPEGYVPHQAMHAERMKRQELEKKIADLEALVTKPQQEETPKYVDPLEDPEGYRKYDEWSRTQAMKRLEDFQKTQQQREQEQARFSEAARLEAEFAAQTPDYPKAAEFLHSQRVTELRNMGYGDNEIAQQIRQDANGLFDAARAAGMNPAELLYYRAQKAGYGNTPAPEGKSDAEKIVQLDEAQRKTQGVGSAGGGRQSGRLTASQLAEMSEADFEKAMRESPDEVRRAMGG